jgi:hypothetical protein
VTIKDPTSGKPFTPRSVGLITASAVAGLFVSVWVHGALSKLFGDY